MGTIIAITITIIVLADGSQSPGAVVNVDGQAGAFAGRRKKQERADEAIDRSIGRQKLSSLPCRTMNYTSIYSLCMYTSINI